MILDNLARFEQLPLVSVVTISYNAEEYITKTIDSILALDYANLEVVFVDGLSTDNTLTVIKSFEKHFVEKGIDYTIIAEKDTGIYNAMNKGLYAIQGDTVIFMNSGDYFHPQFKLNELVTNHDIKNNIVIGYSIQVFRDLYFLRTKPDKESHLAIYPAHQAIFVPKLVYKNVSFDESFQIAADFHWINACMKKAPSQIFRGIISVFSLGGKSSSSRFSDIYLLHKESGGGNLVLKTLFKYLLFHCLGKRLAFTLLYSQKYQLLNQKDAFSRKTI